jgi:hypothetical protein
VGDIEKAYNNNDFFAGFILATTYFEYEVSRILGYLIADRLPLEVLKEWHLWSKLGCLFRLDLIDCSTRKKIEGIIKIRNKLMHPSGITDKQGREHDLLLGFRLNEIEKSLLLNFRECYSKLVQADFRLFKEKLGDNKHLKSL